MPVDRVTGGVRAERLVAGNADHSLGGDAAAAGRLPVVPVLGPEGGARLVGTGEGIEARIGPVVEDPLEGGQDDVAREVLDVIQLRLPIGVVVTAGEEVDGPVVIHGADDAVE